MENILEIGQGLLSILNTFFLFILICLITIFVAKVIFRLLSQYFEQTSRIINVDPTQYRFLKHLIMGVVYLCGIGLAIYTIPSMRQLSLSIFASSGIAAVIVGFAAQQALSHLVSGMFIIIFKPFRVGDRIRIYGKDVAGIVEDLTLRHTIIKTMENKRVVVPNSVMSAEIIENANLEDKICKFFEIGISYDSDIDKAIKILREEAMKHPGTIDNRSDEDILLNAPIVWVEVINLGESSVDLRAWIWTKGVPEAFDLTCDLNKNVKKRFDSEGIEIPYPHRTVVMKKTV